MVFKRKKLLGRPSKKVCFADEGSGSENQTSSSSDFHKSRDAIDNTTPFYGAEEGPTDPGATSDDTRTSAVVGRSPKNSENQTSSSSGFHESRYAKDNTTPFYRAEEGPTDPGAIADDTRTSAAVGRSPNNSENQTSSSSDFHKSRDAIDNTTPFYGAEEGPTDPGATADDTRTYAAVGRCPKNSENQTSRSSGFHESRYAKDNTTPFYRAEEGPTDPGAIADDTRTSAAVGRCPKNSENRTSSSSGFHESRYAKDNTTPFYRAEEGPTDPGAIADDTRTSSAVGRSPNNSENQTSSSSDFHKSRDVIDNPTPFYAAEEGPTDPGATADDMRTSASIGRSRKKLCFVEEGSGSGNQNSSDPGQATGSSCFSNDPFGASIDASVPLHHNPDNKVLRAACVPHGITQEEISLTKLYDVDSPDSYKVPERFVSNILVPSTYCSITPQRIFQHGEANEESIVNAPAEDDRLEEIINSVMFGVQQNIPDASIGNELAKDERLEETINSVIFIGQQNIPVAATANRSVASTPNRVIEQEESPAMEAMKEYLMPDIDKFLITPRNQQRHYAALNDSVRVDGCQRSSVNRQSKDRSCGESNQYFRPVSNKGKVGQSVEFVKKYYRRRSITTKVRRNRCVRKIRAEIDKQRVSEQRERMMKDIQLTDQLVKAASCTTIRDVQRHRYVARRRYGHLRSSEKKRRSAKTAAAISDRYSEDSPYRKQFRSSNCSRAKKAYHSKSPYRRTVIQRASMSIKRKYSRSATFRLRTIQVAAERSALITASSSKKRQRRAVRSLKYDPAGRSAKRRKLFCQSFPEKDQIRSRTKQYQQTAKFKEWKKNYNRQRQICMVQSKVRDRTPRNLVHVLSCISHWRRHNSIQPTVPYIRKGTAEYKKTKLQRWKRYKINYLMSMSHPEQLNINNGDDRYKRSREDIARTLEQLLIWQKQQRSVLYQQCTKVERLQKKASDLINETCDDSEEDKLVAFYGGVRYHIAGHEEVDVDISSFEYRQMCRVLDFDDNDDASAKTRFSETMIRLCDESCNSKVFTGWARQLHEKLKMLNPELMIQKLLTNASLFEKCDNCDVAAGKCPILERCTDTVRYVYGLKSHYSGLRTLVNCLYRIRRTTFELHLVELLLKVGSYSHLTAYKEMRFPDYVPDGENQTDNPTVNAANATDKFICAKYKKVISCFRKRLYKDMPLYECYHCLRLVAFSHSKRYERDHKFFSKREPNIALSDYQAFFNREPIYPVVVCDSCIRILNKGQRSPYSYQNQMWPARIPIELLSLNAYEQMMITLAKSFQRIIRLRPCRYRNIADNTLTKAVKGLAIHLPMPLNSVQNVCDILTKKITLPDCRNFIIQLDGLPNMSKKIIFRSMVDMSVVMTALDKLKEMNFLYDNVYIDRSFVHMAEVNLPEMYRDLVPVPDIADVDQNRSSEETISATIDELVEKERQDNQALGEANIISPRQPQVVLNKGTQSALLRKPLSNVQHSTEHEEDAIDASTTNTVCKSPATVKATVQSLKFAIPYAVPYRSVLLDELSDKTSLVMHMPEGDLLEQYSVVDMSPLMPNKRALELFAMKPISGVPLKWEDPYIDVASFPVLFPDGRNGLFEQRSQRVMPAYYLEHRFRISDPRFRRDQPYLFDSAIRKDMMSINGSIYHLLNTGAFGNVTVKQITDGTKNLKDSKKLEDNVHALMGSIVGTLQYWLRVRRDVEAVIEEYGPATLFMTFSCAEYHNEDFSDFLIFRNFDIPNVRNVPTRNLASIDPVSVSLHFDNRFYAFWNEVIMAEEGPLGCVEIFYIKKEYQQRGAPHMHVLVWIKDAPKVGKDSDEDVLTFVNDRMSCTMPDEIESPVLHQLVTRFQVHKCTTTCTRYAKFKKGFGKKVCRFGFPRSVTRTTVLNDLDDVLASRVAGSRRMQLYNLQRSIHEMMINDYNPVLLYIWQSNIDIQYVGHDNPSITYYTTAYMSKGETQKASEVAQTLNASLSRGGMMKQFCCKMLNSRELGAYEAADKVLRNPMYRLSVEVKSAAFYRPSELRRRLLPLNKLRNLAPDSTDVFGRNFQCSYYPDRPSDMENMSSYEVLRWYDVKSGKSKKTTSFYIQKHQSSFVLRSKPAAIKMYKPSAEHKDAYEKYCFLLMCLFKPWRKIEDLLVDFDGNVKTSYAAVFEAVKDQFPGMIEYAAAKDRLEKSIESAEKIKQKAVERAEREAMEERELNQQRQTIDVDLTLDADLCFQSAATRAQLTEDQLAKEYDSLNEGQRKAFDAITCRIGEQNDEETRKVTGAASDCEEGKDPIFLYVSGVGGTGKSHLIRCVRNYVEYRYSKPDEPAVLVAAPTGIAAMNIDGITIHKLLKLPIQKSEKMHQLYYSLAPDDLKMLRRLFSNVRILIIDEISMLSNMYFLFVYKRLNEILVDMNEDPEASFGNVNILLLGDLLQLPPVNAPYVYTPVTSRDITKAFGSIGGEYHLWKMFDFVELTENMRQRDDSRYAAMLDRVRVGSPTVDDLQVLRSRLINSETDEEIEWELQLQGAVRKYLELMKTNPSILCLMPLNADVSTFNLQVMQSLQLSVVESLAQDMVENIGKSLKAKQGSKAKTNNKENACKKKLKVSETGGLEEKLQFAVGARVMLRRNMDPQKKLVNGSIGIITSIDANPYTKEPQIIRVAFNGVDEPVRISKLTTKFMLGNGLFMTRVQFPVTLAYAITIHKCQGLSLDVAMVDIGPSAFTDSMSYVALSRVKKLSNLYLVRFEPSMIKCDKRCVVEYNRLRQVANQKLISDGLPEMPLITNYNANPEFKKWNKKVTVTVEDQKKQLAEEMSDVTRSRSERTKRKVLTEVVVEQLPKRMRIDPNLSVIDEVPVLKLRNDDAHACFANSVIQCLLRCELANEKMLVSANLTDTAEALVALIEAKTSRTHEMQSADMVRNSFGSTSQYSRHSRQDCDPVDFIQDLFAKLPQDVGNLFTFDCDDIGVCRACGSNNIGTGSQTRVFLMGEIQDGAAFRFNKVFNTKHAINYRCEVPECKAFSNNFQFQKTFTFPPDHKYLILYSPIARVGSNGRVQLVSDVLLGLCERNLSFLRARWSVIACVEICQGRSTATHYKAYVHYKDSQWVEANDTYRTVLKKKPVFRHMLLYVLEREDTAQ